MVQETQETREVRCRCGERIYTAFSLSARCPNCGRRLFWKCQCGALVERVTNQCPYCGVTRKRSRSERRPPLRLRMILTSGLVGAFVFSLLGYWLLEKVFKQSTAKATSLNLPLSLPSGNFIAQTLKGIMLLFTDLVEASRRIFSTYPILPVFAIIGFVIIATLTARQQHFSWRRLKRHLRRKWDKLVSRQLW